MSTQQPVISAVKIQYGTLINNNPLKGFIVVSMTRNKRIHGAHSSFSMKNLKLLKERCRLGFFYVGNLILEGSRERVEILNFKEMDLGGKWMVMEIN